jgi:hypothetical protein
VPAAFLIWYKKKDTWGNEITDAPLLTPPPSRFAYLKFDLRESKHADFFMMRKLHGIFSSLNAAIADDEADFLFVGVITDDDEDEDEDDVNGVGATIAAGVVVLIDENEAGGVKSMDGGDGSGWWCRRSGDDDADSFLTADVSSKRLEVGLISFTSEVESVEVLDKLGTVFIVVVIDVAVDVVLAAAAVDWTAIGLWWKLLLPGSEDLSWCKLDVEEEISWLKVSRWWRRSA